MKQIRTWERITPLCNILLQMHTHTHTHTPAAVATLINKFAKMRMNAFPSTYSEDNLCSYICMTLHVLDGRFSLEIKICISTTPPV